MYTIELTESCGRDISAFSMFPQESEVLLPPNVRFKVVDHFEAGNGLTMVQLQQVASTDPLIKFGTLSRPAMTSSTSKAALTAIRMQVMDRDGDESTMNSTNAEA